MSETITPIRQKIEDRIVRYSELNPCLDAFIDTRTPGSDKKENFTIIGPGVSENPNQHVHISEPHGFNIGGARQPPGCTNSQHSHTTVEVFYVHSGQWRFDLGEHGEDAQTTLYPGDLISIPTNVFRGFTNTGDDTGYLWAVLGGDDPGRVLWAPKVFQLAKEYGLVLLEDGSLIDQNKGEQIPPGKNAMPVTSDVQIARLDRYDNQKLESCVIRSGAGKYRGEFQSLRGVEERRLIGIGQIDWDHGFTLSEILIAKGAAIPEYHLNVRDVLFIDSGNVVCSIEDETTILSAGDTITFPIGARRSLRNAGDIEARIVAVRGSDREARIEW
ncbi:MAG: cupin domain-containing protein [Pseudomonadota bacterium]